MAPLSIFRSILRDSGPRVVYECRICGVMMDQRQNCCRSCGSTEIARYELA